MTQFISNREIYDQAICGVVPQAKERLWIATADIKDMYVDDGGRDLMPFLEVLDGMLKRSVERGCLRSESSMGQSPQKVRRPQLWQKSPLLATRRDSGRCRCASSTPAPLHG